MSKILSLFFLIILFLGSGCGSASDSGSIFDPDSEETLDPSDPVQEEEDESDDRENIVREDDESGLPQWEVEGLFPAKDYNSTRYSSQMLKKSSTHSVTKALIAAAEGNDNPLGSTEYLMKRSEFFISGVELKEQDSDTAYVSETRAKNWMSAVFQDKSADSNKYYISDRYNGEGSGWDCPKKSVGADVDGDGRQEIIMALFDGDRRKLRMINSDDEDKTVSSHEVLDIAAYTDWEPDNKLVYNDSDGEFQRAYMATDIAAGDIDDDGRDEIIFCSGRELYIRNDSKRDFSKLYGKKFDIFDENDRSYYYMRLSTADFNLDGHDELVVVVGNDKPNTAEYYIYDFSKSSSNPSVMKHAKVSMSYDGNTYSLRAADITTGDFDHDGLPEIAFGGRYSGSDLPGDSDYKTTERWFFMVLNTEIDDEGEPEFKFYSALAQGSSTDSSKDKTNIIPPMNTADITGDGYPEIVAGKQILYLSGITASENTAALSRMWSGDSPSSNTPSTNDVIVDEEDGKMALYDIVAVGDFTKDGKDDIAFLTRDEKYINILSDKSGKRSARRIELNRAYDVEDNDTRDFFPVISAVDFDEDSLRVRYIQHEVIYSKVDVVAVLDSPPYWEGFNGPDEGYEGGTTYEDSHSEIEETSRIHSISVGATVGFKVGEEDVADVETKITATHCWSWGWSKTTELTNAWGFTANLGEAKVYMIRIPYDVYYYEILMSSNQDQIGDVVSIRIPRTIENAFVSLEYYNESVENYNSSITTYNTLNNSYYSTLSRIEIGHEFGNPASYSSSSDLTLLKNNCNSEADDAGYDPVFLYSTAQNAVGRGGGTSFQSISTSSSEFDIKASTWTGSLAVEAEIGWAILGFEVSYSNEYTVSTGFTDSTTVTGEVPDIPNSLATSYEYNWGLMMYTKGIDRSVLFNNTTVTGKDSYLYVTYWTDAE